MKGDRDEQEKAEAPEAVLGVDRAQGHDRTVRILARVLPAPTRALCGERDYRIVRRASGAALRYERLVPKVKGKAARKAAKRARRAEAAMKINHLDIVQREHSRQPPTSGDLLSCFRFEQRVLARLAREFPGERWGYLKKGGDNSIPWNGEPMVKVGRVCGPDAQLYKILTDIPTTNAPIWTDDGNVAADNGGRVEQFYMPYDGATGVVDGPVDPPPVDPPLPLDFAQLEQAISIANHQLVAQEAMIKQLSDTVDALAKLITDGMKINGLAMGQLASLIRAERKGKIAIFGTSAGVTINPL